MDKNITDKLVLDSGSEAAVYVQIATQLKELIDKGSLLPGTRLTERELAETYGVGRSTVTMSLNILKDQGLIETVPKKGTFVKEDVWTSFVEKSMPDWYRYIKTGSYPESRPELKKPYEGPVRKSGSSYTLNESYGPYEPLRKAYRDMAEDPNLYRDISTFDGRGSAQLRQTLIKHLESYGITTGADSIVMFPGYVEALSTISRAFMTHGTNVYCMQTDQIAYYPTFRSVGANIYEIPRDNNGPVPESFEKMIKHGKLNMLYINPVNSFPTGITYSQDTLMVLKDICFKYNIPIIENDFLRDFWVDEPPRPMKASDSHNQVIYIGTMGTNYASGASIAWTVLPDMAINRLLYVKMFMHTPSNCSNELLANKMLANGYYTDYMGDLRGKMTGIIASARNSLEKHLTGLAEWEPGNISYTTWLKVKGNVTAETIAQENPYYISPGRLFTGKSNYVLIYTLSMTAEQFEDMAFHLAESIKRRL